MAGRQIEVRRSKTPYTNIQNDLIWDEALQPKTRWLLIAMLSLPDDWDYSVRGLAGKTGMSKDTIGRMLGELEKAGYLKRKQGHEETGHFQQIQYILTDVPWDFAPRPIFSDADDEGMLCGDAPCPNAPCTENEDAAGNAPCTENEDTAGNAPCPNLPCPVPPDPANSPQQNNISSIYTPYSPPQGDGGEGVSPKSKITPKAGKKSEEKSRMWFERFWAAYPRKKNKDRAWRAWKRLNPDRATCDAMAHALDLDKQSKQWNKDNGEYIPHPSTWLRNRPWEDGEDMLQPETVPDEPLRGEGVRYL